LEIINILVICLKAKAYFDKSKATLNHLNCNMREQSVSGVVDRARTFVFPQRVENIS
jgi:hypothetical protein